MLEFDDSILSYPIRPTVSGRDFIVRDRSLSTLCAMALQMRTTGLDLGLAMTVDRLTGFALVFVG